MAKYALLASSYGQTAVFVFILLSVGLVIGLSLSARTLTNLTGAQGSDLSSRAFAAAEAGAEAALGTNLSSLCSSGCPQNVTATFNSTNQSGASYTYSVSTTNRLLQTIPQDGSAQVDLHNVNRNGTVTGTLKIYFIKAQATQSGGENNNGSKPSLELTFLSGSTSAGSTDYSIYKASVDGDSTHANNFTVPCAVAPCPSVTITGSNSSYTNFTNASGIADSNNPAISGVFASLVTVNIANNDNFTYLRIRPLWNQGTVAVVDANAAGGNNHLSTQSYIITSQGTQASTSRVVQVSKVGLTLPPIFDYVLFSGNGSVLK